MKLSIISALCLFFSATGLYAQDYDKIYGRAAEAFPYPLRDFTYISPRYDHTSYSGGNGYFNSYYIRAVYTAQGKFHFRADLPLANTNTPENVFGLADASVRFTHIVKSVGQVFLGYKVRAVFPTATSDYLGSGKWQLHPGIGGIYFMNNSKGSVSFGVEYRFSYAGQSDRERVNVLGINPNFDFWFPKWYIGYYPSWTYNLDTYKWDIPLDIEAGYFIFPRFLLAAEVILPLVRHSSYDYEFALKFRYSFEMKKKK